ncbi:MAG: substrate-binding domain-containing protein, partial [Actinobacteria bacterium]|nr:substrate-binding domain-containing protein [Actinomycetota bacterium]
VSVVGMDDIQSAEVTWPPLTTVSKPKYSTGQTAAEYLVERMGKESEHIPVRHTKLPCQLILRGSTAPPRGDEA